MLQTETKWSADQVLPDFEATTLRFRDDYDGKVYATLVRRKAVTPSHKAVLYLHGYMDYFFQTELAEQWTQHGFNFYALDLRKYGRSLGGATHPNFCKDLNEYFPEISTALLLMAEEDGNDWIVLSGHSTGGLTASLYADSGSQKALIKALFLNSPFFKFNFKGSTFRLIQLMGLVSLLLPFVAVKSKAALPYVESIHADYHGEWKFDLRWRPIIGFPNYAGWMRAILRAHRYLRHGLKLDCPVLVMHSDKSVYGRAWRADFQAGDGVLSVTHIRDGSKYLGPNVKLIEIKDGLHDLVLSRQDVREKVYSKLFGWLADL